jgi:hypothetical protein
MDCIKRWAFEQHIRHNYIWIVFAVIQVFINRKKKFISKSDFVAISIAFTQSPSAHRPLIKKYKKWKKFDFKNVLRFFILYTLNPFYTSNFSDKYHCRRKEHFFRKEKIRKSKIFKIRISFLGATTLHTMINSTLSNKMFEFVKNKNFQTTRGWYQIEWLSNYSYWDMNQAEENSL